MALIEMRVHGVSGTPPDIMLGTAPVVLEDRGDTRIFRPAPAYGGLRAYQWSSLTSGSPRKALWLLLVPYMLLNVAGWALPPRPPRVRRAAVVVVRLAGLALTALFSFVAGIGFVELGGYWLASRRLGWFGPEGGVVVGGLVAAFVLVGLWMVTSRAEHPGPGRDPFRRFLHSRSHPGGSDPAADVSVGDPATWESDLVGETLRNLHIGVALAVVAAAVVFANGALSGAGPAPPGLVVLAAVGAGVVVTAVTAALRRDGTHRWVEPASFLLALTAAAALASLLVLSALVGPCGRGCVDDPSFRALGDAVRVTVLVYAAATATVFLLGWGGRAVTVAPALMTLAGASGASVGAALIVVGGGLAGAERTEGLERLAEGFLVGGVWVLAVALVLYVAGVRPGPDRTVALFVGLRRWRDRAELVLGTTLAVTFVLVFVDAGAAVGWWDLRPDASWVAIPGGVIVVVGLGLALWAFTSTVRRLLVVAATVGTFGWLTLVDSPALSLFGVRLGFAGFTDTAVSVTLLLPLGLVATRIVGAVRSREDRRTLAIIWDVGSFFPRWFHPFAPPAYGPVAVPDLADVIRSHVDGPDRLLLACHSQGSVVAAAAVRAYGVPAAKVALLTFGSPLGSLYRRFFPAHFDDGFFDGLDRALGGPDTPAWVNLFRADDPIGGPVRPGIDAPPLDDPEVRIHGGYWFEPAYGEAVAALSAMLGSSPGGGSVPTSPSGSR